MLSFGTTSPNLCRPLELRPVLSSPYHVPAFIYWTISDEKDFVILTSRFFCECVILQKFHRFEPLSL